MQFWGIYFLAPVAAGEVFGESMIPGDCMVAYSWGSDQEGALPFCAGGICLDVPDGPRLMYKRYAVPLW